MPKTPCTKCVARHGCYGFDIGFNRKVNLCHACMKELNAKYGGTVYRDLEFDEVVDDLIKLYKWRQSKNDR